MANLGDRDKKGKKWEDYKRIKCPNGEIIDMEKLLDEQEWAKAALFQKCPIWGKFINDLRFVYTFRVNTQATDGYNIFVNPQFTASLSPAQKVFVMAHEIMHCLLEHLRRSKIAPYNSDHDKANIAADYECNDTLVEMDVVKVGTIHDTKAYYDKKFINQPFETIWDHVSTNSGGSMKPNPGQNQNQQSGGQQQSGQGGQGSQNGQGNQDSQGSGGGNQKSKEQSAAYKRGWKIARALHKAGKLPV